ncbi:MAG: response regulator, partial [Peptococcaceae bacterium]|nr:response regulator [Peptococcaceae bacterium]
AEMPSKKRLEENYAKHLYGKRILLVEDNKINQEVAKKILSHGGMSVVIAKNGEEALEKLDFGTYDLVLMDIQMPVKDGYDTTKEIRKNPEFAELPIIAMTANVLQGQKEKCLQAGMNDYIPKPIDITLLFQTIVHWIGDIENPERIKESAVEYEEKAILEHHNNNEVLLALKRLGNNKELFRKIQVKFYNNHRNDIGELRRSIAVGDFQNAERIAHTVKSVAALIGEREAVEAADVLEQMLRSESRQNREFLVSRLERILDKIFSSIATWYDDTEVSPALEIEGGNIYEILPLMEILAVLLKDNDIVAEEYIKDVIRYTKDPIFSDRLEKIRVLVDQYNFEEAWEILDKILGEIRESLKNGSNKQL